MNRKASFNGLANVIMYLSEEEQLALIDCPKELKIFAGELVIQIQKNTFFKPISDNGVPGRFVKVTHSWRKLAAELGYTGPVAWLVKEGFTIGAHAPKTGPCKENFQYLNNLGIQGDEPTKDSIVFWVPRLVPGSEDKTVSEQTKILTKLRKQFGLPEHHLSSYGNASLNSGLILTHFKRTGERVPFNGRHIRTDSRFVKGDNRIHLGDFIVELLCAHHGWNSGRDPMLGCFPLGVELLLD